MKQVILINNWLEMPTGKLIAQAAHASLAPLSNLIAKSERNDRTVSIEMPQELIDWFDDSFTKLALIVRSEAEWAQVKKKLDKDNIEYFEIIDKGLTVFNGIPTHTCTGFYPMKQEEINKYFGHLPLAR